MNRDKAKHLMEWEKQTSIHQEPIQSSKIQKSSKRHTPVTYHQANKTKARTTKIHSETKITLHMNNTRTHPTDRRATTSQPTHAHICTRVKQDTKKAYQQRERKSVMDLQILGSRREDQHAHEDE